MVMVVFDLILSSPHNLHQLPKISHNIILDLIRFNPLIDLL